MIAVSEAAIETVLRRERVIIAAALVMLTALAWAYTIWLATRMNVSDMPDGASSMTQMSMETMLAPVSEPRSAAHFFFLTAMWSVMMVGMMTPSVAPMVLLYARVGRQAAQKGQPIASTGIFVGGYLLAWVLFSLVAAAGQTMLDHAALLTPMMGIASRSFGGFVLIAAGLFQWTPLKDICLQHCQSPLAFIQRHGGYQRDPLGSLGLGLRHGLYCVGCCWALMALLFVGGVMNVLWIAMLMIFVLLEKLVASGLMFSRIAGLGLIAWGAWLVASPMS